MTDVARLGLAIDSSQASAASTALDKFQRSANAAAAGADKLASSAKPAATNAAALQKSADTAGKALDKVGTSTGLARHEMINLSRQLQDVGVSLAGGQSPFTVLFQQGSQIADIFGSSKTGTVGGALKQIGGSITSLITPMRLLGLTVAGLAVGGVFAFKSIGDSAKQFDDVARSVNTTAGALHSLQQAAAFKGIGQDDFFKGAKQFADGLYEAQHNMGLLGEFLRANGQTAGDFQTTLGKVADIIKSASNDQERLQLLQRAGLPATMDWVRFLSQGKDGIRAATEEAVKFNDSAEGKLVASARKFDEAWNKATTNLANNFKSALLNALSGLDDFTFSTIAKLKELAGNTYGNGQAAPKRIEVTGGTTDKAGPKAVDPEVLKRQISLQQQQLGIYGQTLTSAEAVRQVELAVQSARLQGVSIDEKRLTVLKELAREQQNGVTMIKSQIDAENINAATVGMSVGQAAQYTATQNALNEAKRNGRVLSEADTAAIRANAAALGDAAKNADNMRFAYTSLLQGPMQTFTSAIQQGATAMDALKKAGISALSALANKLTEMAAQNLWSSAFGGSSGFGLGSLFGGGSAPTMSGTGLGAGTGGLSFPMFASGTNNAPGGWSVVGEKGPELINVPKGSQILPNGVAPGGVNVTGGSTTIVIQGSADEKTLAIMKQELAKRDAAFNTNVVNTVRQARTQRRLS